MILLFTDFGLEGPYQGQMQMVVAASRPQLPVITLMADAPCQNPRAAAYLLAAYTAGVEPGTVTVAVVDPGVGGEREAIIVRADGRWYVGPDNGLLDVVCLQAQRVERWAVTWRPAHLSASFHGRDLFTPVAVQLARGEMPDRREYPFSDTDLLPDLAEIVYIDHFGNLISGLRGSQVPENARLRCRGVELPHGLTFSQVQPGEMFWYVNSNGLVEIAANQASAAAGLACEVGSGIEVL